MTPSGAILTVYVLNVVGWGAMLFFLLLGVAPTMSRSTRLRWIEITSQIMNAFFCIAAFCPIPWRFRDFYYLLAWRVKPDSSAMMVLSHIHKGWFRLTPSEDVICGLEPETRKWKVDLVIYLLVANTLNQVFLCYVMWGYGPSDRPVWAVVLLVVLGCTFGAAAGNAVESVFHCATYCCSQPYCLLMYRDINCHRDQTCQVRIVTAATTAAAAEPDCESRRG